MFYEIHTLFLCYTKKICTNSILKSPKKGKFIVTIYFSISDTGITQAPAVPVQHSI